MSGVVFVWDVDDVIAGVALAVLVLGVGGLYAWIWVLSLAARWRAWRAKR